MKKKSYPDNDTVESSKPYIWFFLAVMSTPLIGLILVRGRNFISVGTDWKIAGIVAILIAWMIVAVGPLSKGRLFFHTWAVLSVMVFGTLMILVPALYTRIFGVAVERNYTVAEIVTVSSGGCARSIKFVEFEGRMDNHICVDYDTYARSAIGKSVLVRGTESILGIWLDDVKY